MRSKFKDEHPFEKRKAEAERIRQKYADRIPLTDRDTGHLREGREVRHRHHRQEEVPGSRRSHRRPVRLCDSQAHQALPEKAIFIFVDEVLPPTAALMSSIYEEHKDEDGFLYITYSGENTFGDL
ncbi:Autophagy-related protein 8 [Penicillium cosmopolitanum]|uniref:Autophagy-related protein n=1 Tax=Penicillium cosmopolitanum TaxID=1131564 RepID=A0A9X0BET6_9EURO|nr:Autophagy-related protein 8 [Penicillium cosmopolitanum]KAJ5414424.1 Autophagy-related protein 8 [Penicillium cosmopolitanum]